MVLGLIQNSCIVPSFDRLLRHTFIQKSFMLSLLSFDLTLRGPHNRLHIGTATTDFECTDAARRAARATLAAVAARISSLTGVCLLVSSVRYKRKVI